MSRAAPGFIFAVIAALTASACNMQGTPTSAKAAASDECKAGSKLGTSDAGLELLTLCIESGGKTRSFTVEHAASTREQAQGLMFRKSLSDDAGMIFPYQSPRMLGFWMKNTLIPLDIMERLIASRKTLRPIPKHQSPPMYPCRPCSNFAAGLQRNWESKLATRLPGSGPRIAFLLTFLIAPDGRKA